MKNKLYILLFLAFLFPGTTLWIQQKVTPKAGEDISSFLSRHNCSPKKYYDDFIELSKQKLGKNNMLRVGVTYVIPPVEKSASESSGTEQQSPKAKSTTIGTTISELLLGRQLAGMKVTSNRLAGAYLYVMNGYGGPDSGAIGRVGKHELHEGEHAYDITPRLAYNLMREGAEIRIIIQDTKDGIRGDSYPSNSKREACMDDPIPLNQVQHLQQRRNKINALYRRDHKDRSYRRAIFTYIDSRSKGKRADVFFYYSGKKRESKRSANSMKNMFESKYDKHQPNRSFSGTVSGRNLYILSHTTPASVFVELGNIRNTFDQHWLMMNLNRQALTKWLAGGFLRNYKEKK